MKKSEESKKLFKKGYNCAQSILYTYGKEYFKENANAIKLATGFGAGISYQGELCGAVSGALMVIGLHYGFADLNDNLSKELTVKISNEFIESFKSKNGSIICNQLLETKINTPKGFEYAKQNELFDKICPNLVENGSEILESLLQKYPIKT